MKRPAVRCEVRNRSLRHPCIAKLAIVYKAPSNDCCDPPQSQLLLREYVAVQAMPVRDPKIDVADKAILVFEAMTDRSLCPASSGISGLIIEAGTVDVGDGMKREGIGIQGWDLLIVDSVNIAAMQDVLEAGQSMLPARWSGDGQLQAGQQIVLPGPLVEVRGKDGIAVEIPLILHPAHTVVMTNSQTQRRPIIQLRSQVRAFE